MAKVSNLQINLQSNSGNTYYASWEFTSSQGSTTTTTSSSVKVGSLVTINEGATYYNGVKIPNWVKEDEWYISSLKGDRAVLGKNKDGSNNIKSPINTKNITVVGSSSSSSSSSENISVSNLDYYEVKWYYDSGDGVWFSGGENNVKETNDTYSPPSNTVKIKVSVKPVSKTKTVNNKETPYWTGTAVTAEFSVSITPPDVPPVPKVTIDKFTLTATVNDITDARTDRIQFRIYDNQTLFHTSGSIDVAACRATYSCSVNAGGKYRVQARAANIQGESEIYSDWSSFADDVSTIPTAVTGLTCKAKTKTSVYLEWTAVNNAKSYTIEYTTDKDYFDGSDKVTEIGDIEFNHYELTGIESGDEYFFRVRAVNDQGESGWSNIVSLAIGKPPSAPTTWSSTTTAVVGESLTLYWIHNSEDGSTQTSAKIELYVGASKTEIPINTANQEDEDKTMHYAIDTSQYTEGTTIRWRVQTAGVTGEYGDWSVQRTIEIYAPATLSINVTDRYGDSLSILKSFPLYIRGVAGPASQKVLGYHVSIISNATYTTVDNIGNTITVSNGDEVYSKYFDTSERLILELSASHVNLQNGVTYSVIGTVSMNSGLSATARSAFAVSWTDETYELDAKISIDKQTLTAYISPYCVDRSGNLVSNVKLSVYRREFDGSFTEIATGIDNTSNTYVPDPHPALDYARYRVIGVSESTGAVSFYDVPGYPIGEYAAVIQWNEQWVGYETTNSDAMEQPNWSGSMLKLQYNLDVSDTRNLDVSLVEYIGRRHPVSYYGTQVGETSSWSMKVPKNDTTTLYALRRLSVWMGDVYVREPSGSGYWANISVSFSQKHRELVIPVTLEITRVSGGV